MGRISSSVADPNVDDPHEVLEVRDKLVSFEFSRFLTAKYCLFLFLRILVLLTHTRKDRKDFERILFEMLEIVKFVGRGPGGR